jgi:glycosyltransferase involved in cell wall biosynthesis
MRKLKEFFKPDLDISVILPVYNEEENIKEMHAEIDEVMQQMGKTYEIIYINDGSNDLTLNRLIEIQEQDPHSVVVEFRRNFGQTAAMSAGFDLARGEVVFSMDSDRQNDPRDIPMMLEKLEEGYDLVAGWRYDRQDGLFLRLIPSKIANKLIGFTTDVKLHDYGCSLKAYRWDTAKQLSMYGEMHRFIPAIASWVGARITEVKVNHRARTAGVSKYGISRTFRVILDLITVKFMMNYSARPLQFFGAIGLVSTTMGMFIGLYLTFQKLFYGVSIGDRPALLLAVLLIFIGLQFITSGLLAEMMTRTYHESQDMPTYTIRKIYGRDSD